MSNLIDTIGSSQEALSRRYRVIAHNLANSNTVGFKKRRSVFSEALPSRQTSENDVLEPASKISEKTLIDFTQGGLSHTGRSLDIAVAGKGFFVVETPDGELYTRNGIFRINEQGQLVDADGNTVAGQGGPITLPENADAAKVQVSNEGRISANGQNVGMLRIVTFDDQSLLKPMGASRFSAPGGETATVASTDDYTVRQGFREDSNVSAVEELVDMISVSRLYEANIKSAMAQDERLRTVLKVVTG